MNIVIATKISRKKVTHRHKTMTEHKYIREDALFVCDIQDANKFLPPLRTQRLEDNQQREISSVVKDDKYVCQQHILTTTHMQQDLVMQHQRK